MPGKFEAPRKKRRFFPILILALLLLLTGGFLAWRTHMGSLYLDAPPPTTISPTQTTTPETTASPTTEPTTAPTTIPAPYVVATATLGAQGDLLMHSGVIQSGRQTDGSYDFSSIFQYVAPYVTACDYAAANLETTFGGSGYPIQGNPEFNCPDQLAQACLDAGYDMLLTVNNHCADTHTDGLKRTLEIVRGSGLASLGTMLSAEEEKYRIIDVNGIQLGMIAYSYADNVTSDGRPSFNYRDYLQEPGLANYFRYNNLDKFYNEMKTHIASMRANGADFTILYIHWGEEYFTEENSTQRAMAQQLCDLGIDVIIGGHPHVVQPVQLLESTEDDSHKTICIYSLGNTVSNQMIGVDAAFKSGHSEDGAMLRVTFEKYSDDTVRIASADVLPTWVNRNNNTGSRQYNIIPLEDGKQDQWQELYGLTDEQLASAQNSYKRTMEIVSAGLEACREYLDAAA